jgi:NAD(P)H-quinone oxidoreductase subunit 5
MIRLGLLMTRLEAAQTLLVVVGTTTAILAGFVMMTRISVKVSLAWSTCAQMGFMLLECGLGAYQLALLHLLGHSIYKAYAFLASGRAVETQILRAMFPKSGRGGFRHWLGAAVAAGAVVLVTGIPLGLVTGADGATSASLVILAFALAPLFAQLSATSPWPQTVLAMGLAIGFVAVYADWHALMGVLLPNQGHQASPGPWRLGGVLAAFTLAYGVQARLRAVPDGRLAEWLYPWAFAGFYVDELFTRLTFRLWPPLPAAAPPSTAPFLPLEDSAR